MDLDVKALKAPNPDAVVQAVNLQRHGGHTLRALYSEVQLPVKVGDLQDKERFNAFQGGWGSSNQGIDLTPNGEFEWRRDQPRFDPAFDEAVALTLSCEEAASRLGRGHLSERWRVNLTGGRTEVILPNTVVMHTDFQHDGEADRQYVEATESGIITVAHNKMVGLLEEFDLGYVLDIPFAEMSYNMKQGFNGLTDGLNPDQSFQLLDQSRRREFSKRMHAEAEEQDPYAVHLTSRYTFHMRDPYCSTERLSYRAFACDGPE